MTTIKELYELFLKYPAVSTDTRNIIPGSLFFALKGDKFDGNQFARQAIENGAAFAVIDDIYYQVEGKTILVEDVLGSLQQLARYHRRNLRIRILGITGTNGKTTTKELVTAVLGKKFRVFSTRGNLNNHIGVPLTLLGMNSETEFGVVEMGANHPGEISALCNIAEPDFGLITNIGKAHLEGFGSFEGVIKTKSELYQFIKKNNGLIFIHSDNQILNDISVGMERKFSYGKNSGEVRGEIISEDLFLKIKAGCHNETRIIESNLTGNYNFENVLAAVSAGCYFGVGFDDIVSAMKAYEPKNNRSQLIQRNGKRIIMDAYNANPTSMMASLQSFIGGDAQDKALIIGDMLELGTYSAGEHQKIIRFIRDSGCENVFCVGREFAAVAPGFGYKSFQDVDQFCIYLKQHPVYQTNILIKGSRGVRLEKVLELI